MNETTVKCAHCGNWFPVELQTGTITEKDVQDWQNEPGAVFVTKAPAPSFEEVFEAFDRWYWDKYRHHPPKMESGEFYEFLIINGIVK